MAVCELTTIDGPAGFGDDGWEEFEETHCKRRAHRRPLRSASPRDSRDGDGFADRDDDATRRLLFGGYGFHGLGALLLIIGLLIVGAAYFGPGRGGGAIFHTDRPTVVVEQHDRLTDYGRYEPYPNAYYASRFEGLDDRGDADHTGARGDHGYWTTTTVGWSAGGLLLLFGILVLVVAVARSFNPETDD
jgi:hypothetical protein